MKVFVTVLLIVGACFSQNNPFGDSFDSTLTSIMSKDCIDEQDKKAIIGAVGEFLRLIELQKKLISSMEKTIGAQKCLLEIPSVHRILDSLSEEVDR